MHEGAGQQGLCGGKVCTGVRVGKVWQKKRQLGVCGG